MYNHLELLLLANRYHLQPLHVHLTSIEKNYRTKSALEDDDRVYASFHKSHFLDLFPRKDLVYLTADGPPMKEFDTKCTYIIGGIGDFGTEKYTTLKFAKKHGLRYASFPISDYFSAPNIDLRAYCVHSILLEMYLHGSWKEAFIKHLPHMFTLLKDVATDSDIKLRENCLTKEHSDKEWFRNSEKIVNILKGKRAII
ncbi:tRNA methyltransferase 10 homolog A-like [Ruditapes philippinarum]|uniref:tRNA methyltransferase 10 homolog A-like n=1 Tax=Ruditapes philippinarum TaxID=129788 RepID=UPI00295AE9A4|nr:tRNA methyltransferase 10 homolog A-like [Ruditapes philippinarum]